MGLSGRDRDGFRTLSDGSNLIIQVAACTGGPVDISKLFELEIARWGEVGLVLQAWCTKVRRLCAKQVRSEVGDVHIGGLLSYTPSDRDGGQTCGPVCKVMQSIALPEVANGSHTAFLNARGAQWRSMEAGGGQERELAVSYRARSRQLAFEYPYVSAIFERIADEYERDGTWYDSEAGVRKRIVD